MSWPSNQHRRARLKVGWRRGVWFITGASSGFGHALASAVLEGGGRVAATARDARNIANTHGVGGDRLLALSLDVTDDRRAQAAIAEAQAHFGGIDVLVNNAGYGLVGAIEEASFKEINHIMDVNFLAQIRLIRAVLPDMRIRRSGYVINLSSLVGVRPVGGTGYYAASKFAVEGMSEALRRELEPLGIGVLIVEPGPFRTNYAQKYLAYADRSIADYAETAGKLRVGIAARHGAQPGDPERAAREIIAALDTDDPPHRLVLGRLALDSIRKTIEERLQEIDTWAGRSLKADFSS
jgi:NADP-dependent 3-hydroxy acid dehydrogenase YdfG